MRRFYKNVSIGDGQSVLLDGKPIKTPSAARLALPTPLLAGLSFDTKFDLSRVIELPFSTRWFAVPPGAPHGQSPKMGLLHPTAMRRAAAASRASRRQ